MLRGLRRRARYVIDHALIQAPGSRVKILEIDPQEIRFVQFPELWTIRQRGGRPLAVQRTPGEWDTVDAATELMWSGRYEGAGRPSRMVPIERFGFYRACMDRFGNGSSWQATAWHQWLLERIAAGDRILRYETPERIRVRLQLLDRMFAEIERSGYRSALERQAHHDPDGMPRWLQRPTERDEPIVNMGRQRRFSVEDGRHRLCLARIAGAPRVRVRVGTIHTDATD